jgi:phosphatidylinositol alpha-mannosyltransferase
MPSPAPLKIGFVLDDSLDKPDGVQQYVIAMGEWLRRQGHDVHYLVSTTTRTDLTTIHNLGRSVRVRFNGNGMGTPLPASTARIRRLLADEQFDVLHVQVPYSPFLAHKVIMNAPRTTAVIGTFHILPHTRLAALATKVLGVWLRRSLRRFDAMFSVSPAAQQFARTAFGVESTVLPNVIDYPRFADAKPFESAHPTVLFFGRLVPRKGCLTLLQALAHLQHAGTLPACRVLVCGKGPLRDELEQYAHAQQLDMVEFTGFVTEQDKPRYYATSDISVFPSNGGESFGIVLLEAMASGRAAVLAGDNPGYASVMHERPDLLFAPTGVEALADKLQQMLTDEQVRRDAADWGRSYASHFDVDIVGTQLVAEYRRLLSDRQNMQ